MDKGLIAGQLYLYLSALPMCRDGGTGRRARLKIWWAQARGGSSPLFGTKDP
jgi:hypothetical protein